nr:uncharacterized protein LOC113813468 [Penaeus vannamei]
MAVGSMQDLYLLQVCFLAHLVQLLLTYEKQNPVSEMEVEDDEEGGEEAPKDSAGRVEQPPVMLNGWCRCWTTAEEWPVCHPLPCSPSVSWHTLRKIACRF